jgi:hypothetical protein
MSATETKEMQIASPRGFMNPQSVKEGMELAQWIAKSDLAPKDYKDKPQNVLIAMQMGLELGISPMQSIQNIAVINGRPSVWGDLMLAICQASPAFEWINENDSTAEKGVCIVKRKGMEPQRREFTLTDAATAGLKGKQGSWTTNPARMLKLRARAFALRDTFADALRGLASAEEQEDIIETTAGVMPARASETKKAEIPAPAAPAAPPPPPAASLVHQVEPIEATVTIGDIKKFKDGHFEVSDAEGVIYTTINEDIATLIKEAKGQVKKIEFLPVEGKNPVFVGFKS